MQGGNGRRKFSPVKIIAAVVLVFSMTAAIGLGYLAWAELAGRKQSADYYAELARSEKVTVPAASAAPAAETLPQPTAAEEEQETPMQIPEQPKGSAVDFTELCAKYPRCVGWIEIGDIGVDYPIMLGEDNIYYLNHLADGTENACGAIMMDAACSPDFSCDVTVIHGHHLKNGTMFGSLEKFGDPQFFDEHPTFTLYTPGGDHEVEVFAAYTADAKTFGYPTWFGSAEEQRAFLLQIRENAGCIREMDIQFGDRLVVLSTCAYSFADARFVVIGKMI